MSKINVVYRYRQDPWDFYIRIQEVRISLLGALKIKQIPRNTVYTDYELLKRILKSE